MNTKNLGIKLLLFVGCAVSTITVAPVDNVKANEYEGRETYWNNYCSGIITDDKKQAECSEYINYVNKNSSSEVEPVEEVKSDLSNVEEVSQEYNQRITDVNDDIASIKDNMTSTDDNLDVLAKEMKTTKKKIEKRKKVVADRMVDNQGRANTNQFLNYIMGAEDLIDMIQRAKGIEAFTRSDKEQIELLNKELKTLKNQKAEQKRMRSSLTTQKKNLSTKKTKLKKLEKSNDKMVAKVKAEVKKKVKNKEISKTEAKKYTAVVEASNPANNKQPNEIATTNTTSKNNSITNNTSKPSKKPSTKPSKPNNGVANGGTDYKKPPVQNSGSSNNTSVSKPAPAGNKGATIAAAAKALVGGHSDCTMLVTNALKSVGINFHGWPAEYMSLGTVVSNPKPGDICVYGNAHVAIYIGGGKAVHGGWNGNNIAIASVHCSTGSPVYVRVR